MSHQLRQDPATGRWVIVAPARGRRPGAGASISTGDQRPAAGPATVPHCPFCPGNEEKTPPEVYRLPGGSGGWRVRVVPNLFPAVAPAEPAASGRTAAPGTTGGTGPLAEGNAPAPPAALASLFRAQPAVGVHEVIIDTPHHSRHLADMDVDELAAVLGVYRARYRAALEQPAVRCVALFRNHGQDAGTSQAHPHAQLIAVPLVPTAVRRRWERAARYARSTGRCLYCDLLAAERQHGDRLVLDTNAFVALAAFAPRFPYETWIMPTRHQADFPSASDGELQALAQNLRTVLRAFRDAVGDPPHNLVFYGAPGHRSAFHWHLQVLPRTARPAGFEMGTEMAIVAVPPEQAAAELRAAVRA
ncbi:MAG TPA: DUF4921 family protein [Limnochordales bacterium]|nr:DUF4921 family protein [Limnochordales bacterium]